MPPTSSSRGASWWRAWCGPIVLSWTVLFHEVNANRPLVELVADLRGQVVAAIRAMLEAGASSWPGLAAPASDGVAHAIVGAGESLANWWLEHPTVAREQVTDWYVGLAQAAIASAGRPERG